ncbi:hypothetical protein RRG08_037958 [Elysia crispata]|uniref:Uncharacterized protein n=1 Tax=Elysia crispata TaxID=231223 RepID=A0AAE1ADE3_9GAST|nr:hypothetical protein RRG08_037958 [Elysia crispata]
MDICLPHWTPFALLQMPNLGQEHHKCRTTDLLTNQGTNHLVDCRQPKGQTTWSTVGNPRDKPLGRLSATQGTNHLVDCRQPKGQTTWSTVGNPRVIRAFYVFVSHAHSWR